MPTVLSSAFPLHVETDGDDRRPALLLINPLGATTEFWDPLLDALVAHNWVIRFDLRGHGRSTGRVEPYSIGDIAGDALAVLDALEIPRSHVMGASMGALVAATLAAEHPDRLDRLVLASTGLELGPVYWWEETIRRIEEGGLSNIVDHLEVVLFSDAWREAVPDRLARAREMLLATPQDAYLAGANATADCELATLAPTIRAATLLVVGEDDPVLRHHPATGLLDAIPDSESVSVSGARHGVLLEQPVLLGEVIAEFLTDPDAR